jgi:hypothetical protein
MTKKVAHKENIFEAFKQIVTHYFFDCVDVEVIQLHSIMEYKFF